MDSKEICYELTLTPDYVPDWGFKDAMRELIQNGIDQETLDSNKEFTVDYDRANKILYLKNADNTYLKRNTLLLGKSSKANSDDTVGQFGEGYRIHNLIQFQLIHKNRLKRLGNMVAILLLFLIEWHNF